MAYSIKLAIGLEKKLAKLVNKDKILYSRLIKKFEEIAKNPHIYKPMSNVLKGRYRVHVGHFVLLYKINDDEQVIELEDFGHHDKIYG